MCCAGQYVYYEATNFYRNRGQKAELVSPLMSKPNNGGLYGNCELTFYYSNYGTTVPVLLVYADITGRKRIVLRRVVGGVVTVRTWKKAVVKLTNSKFSNTYRVW